MLSSYHNQPLQQVMRTCLGSRPFPPLGGPSLLASLPLKGSLFPHTTYLPQCSVKRCT